MDRSQGWIGGIPKNLLQKPRRLQRKSSCHKYNNNDDDLIVNSKSSSFQQWIVLESADPMARKITF